MNLYIAYFYSNGGDLDACNYVGKTGSEREFLAYAKEQGWKITEEDIEGIYTVREEEDNKGNKYIINITKV